MRTLVFVVTLLVVQSAAAAGDAVASVGWRLDFGADSIHTGYGLSLGYRNAEHFAPLARMVELKVDDASAVAAVAGLPLFESTYRANQSQADQAYDTGVEQRPWYSKSWVWWTVGGIAASAALGGVSVSSNDSRTCNNCNSSNGGGRTTVYTQNDDGTYVACVQGTCAVCPDGSIQSSCLTGRSPADRLFDARLARADDDANGGMGDLLPQ